MKGELGYKDIHGRIWFIRQRSTFQWLAETRDQGHTTNPNLFSLQLPDLLADIDREEYLIESKTLTAEGTTAGSASDGSGSESEPQSPSEASSDQSEARGSEYQEFDPPIRLEDGTELRGVNWQDG